MSFLRLGCSQCSQTRSWVAAALRGTGRALCVLLILHGFSDFAFGTDWPRKVLRRLIAPLRSHPFLQESATPCSLGLVNCFTPDSGQPALDLSNLEPALLITDPTRLVMLQLRAQHGGPFSHHWLEVESSKGEVTIGYGPATVPFIDAGQISLQDTYGNIERISGMHPFPPLGMPPLGYRYAKVPGSGHPIGKPIALTIAQADALVGKEGHQKFVGPYIPFFHDCRTFACSVQAHAQGSSSLPCYLLFKGYR